MAFSKKILTIFKITSLTDFICVLSFRLEVEVMVEPSCSRAMGPGVIGLTSEPPEDSFGMGYHQESLEPQTLYRDIWTLRASLERYVSFDQSSNNDKDSVRSDADSMCSLGGKTEMEGLPRYPSQDIGDEMEGDADLPLCEGSEKGRKQDSVDSERGSDGEPGNRKLLQMDSGYASIEAPSRAPEELRLFGSSSSSKDGSAIERRHFFSSGHKGSVCESFDTDIFDWRTWRGTCRCQRRCGRSGNWQEHHAVVPLWPNVHSTRRSTSSPHPFPPWL